MVKKYILHFIAALLVFIYGLSFLVKYNKTSEKSFATTLINPDFRKNIIEIDFSSDMQQLFLEKKGATWIGSIDYPEGKMNFPVEQNKVESFFDVFCSVKNVSKVSADKENKDYNLHNNPFLISYKTIDGNSHSICFGNTDFSSSKRFFSTDSSNAVYKTSTEVDRFLYSNPKMWVDNLIIPQNIYGKILPEDIERIILTNNSQSRTIAIMKDSDIKKFETLLSLRHGNLVSADNSSSQDKTYVSILLDKGKTIKFSVTEKQTGDFEVAYELPDLEGYSTEISAWTWNKFLDQLK